VQRKAERIIVIGATFVDDRWMLIEFLKAQAQQRLAFEIVIDSIQRCRQVLQRGMVDGPLTQRATAEGKRHTRTGPTHPQYGTHACRMEDVLAVLQHDGRCLAQVIRVADVARAIGILRDTFLGGTLGSQA